MNFSQFPQHCDFSGLTTLNVSVSLGIIAHALLIKIKQLLILDFLGLSLISLTIYQSPLLWLLLLCLISNDWNAQVSIVASLLFSKQLISLGYFFCSQNLNTLYVLWTLLLWAVFVYIDLCTDVHDISFCICNRHLKLNISKTSFLISPPNLFLPIFLVECNSILPFA